MALRGARRALAMGVIGGGARPNTLDLFFESYVPVLRYKLEELSGTTIANSGSAGAVLNGTISGTYTLGVPSGTLHAGNGVECDGLTTNIAFLHNALISGFAALTLLVVARPDTAGEGDQGLMIAKTNEFILRQGGAGRFVFERNMTGDGSVSALAISAIDGFAYGNVYAFAAKIGADKIPHTFLNGVETGYQTQRTGVGDFRASENNGAVASSGGSITFDGGIFDVAVVEGALSDAAILEHYEAAFLADATAERAVAFSGTSITEAITTGYRPLTQDHLTSTYLFARFTYPQSAYSGSSTWVRLWYMQADLLDIDAPDVIVYECVSPNFEGAFAAQAKAIEEGAIRRLRGGIPAARIIVVGMPIFADNTTPGATNPAQLTFLAALCTQYGMTYVDWPARVQALLDANTYTLDQLYNDIVHPSVAGHAEIAALLQATLTMSFIDGTDAWTGDLGDYVAQYDNGTFENTAGYIARNGTDNDGTTGTWTSDGTMAVSNEAGSTISWAGTFETFGVDIDTTSTFMMAHRLDGGGWNEATYSAGNRSVNQLAPNFLTRGAHTVDLKVVSGTVKIKRFLAI